MAEKNGQKTVVSYKWNHLPVGTGLIDLEQGRFAEATYHDWITDTTVDAGEAWGYMQDAEYKSAKSLIHYLMDNVKQKWISAFERGAKAGWNHPWKKPGKYCWKWGHG